MGTQTKIVVIKAKEIIYTGIFLVLGIVMIVLLFCISKKSKQSLQVYYANFNCIGYLRIFIILV